HPFALVCFRCTAGPDATQALTAAVNATGNFYWTGSILNDEPMIRVSIGQTRTTKEHVERLWKTLSDLA
ncbi:MAG TPA: aspartate aminotransferase family protein, partial [Acidimicrobiaceae bacterium]|nr:aspartate aminotransferase family protein [Acidimicrobiaceae bacterium]